MRERDDYLKWLYFEVLDGPEILFKTHRSLLKTLLDIPYRYTHPMDKNRFKDGLKLREDYSRAYNADFNDICNGCSLLEMLIALAYRMEKEILAGFNEDFDCFRWFWTMIENLELDEFDEKHYDFGWIQKICNRFLDCKYDKNGRNGGIFVVKNPYIFVNQLQIWDQMNAWVNENFDDFG